MLAVSQALGKRQTIEVHLIFDPVKFHPNPIVHIYGKNKNQLIKLKEVEIWNWFEQNTAEDPLDIERIE